MATRTRASGSAHWYTAEDYRRATNNYQRRDYDQLLAEAEAEGNGLGFVYMSSVQKSIEQNQEAWVMLDVLKNRGKQSNRDEYLNQINVFNRRVRKKAAQDMQDYIIEHEGRIGSWPLSRTDFGFFSENSRTGEDVKLSFDYFSSDFSPSEETHVGTTDYITYVQQPGLTYRMECTPEDTDEYKAFRRKLTKMKEKKVATLDKRSKNNWDIILVVMIAAVVLIPTLMMLFWKLLDIGRDAALVPLSWFGSLCKVTAVIALPPMFFVYFLHIIYEVLCISNTVFLISSLILLTASGLWLFFGLKDEKWISKTEALSGEEHLQEIKRLEHSEEYKRLKEENEEYHENQRAFAEIWHKKWFAFCQEHEMYYYY